MTTEPGRVELIPIFGVGEVHDGDDIAALLAERGSALADGDIVAVSSKIVSKAEGRVVPGTSRADAIRSEAVRVVASRGEAQIVATRHGFVMAAAGVDASNVEAGMLVLLPVDPDESARRIRRGLRQHLGVDVGVIITDTFGRPWRLGQTDLAVGAAGVRVLEEHSGRTDRYGNPLMVTAPAPADEIAAAADLVKPKLAAVPAAIVRGLAHLVTADDGPGVAAVVRPSEQDMFRVGTTEAMRDAIERPVDGWVADVSDGPTDPEAIHRVQAIAIPYRALTPGTPSMATVSPLDEADRKELLDRLGLPTGVPCVLLFATEPGSTVGALELGGARERVLRACAIEGLGARWIPADRIPASVDFPAPSRTEEPHDVIGMMAIGAGG